ncbi:MAG: glucose-6-phosphate dehydrogenase assembly protein OpcA [Ktedonobacterales bacterium]
MSESENTTVGNTQHNAAHPDTHAGQRGQPAQDVTLTMRQVDPTAIETELDNSWRMANASALASGGHAGTRNSVMTLLAYTGGDEQTRRALTAIEAMTAQHPSRAIIVVPQRDTSGAPIEAYVATQTQNVTGAPAYGEEIVIKAHDGAVKHLPGVLLPLIVSGLPSFLWWMGEPPWRSEGFEALIDGSDRLIVDTSEMHHAEHSLLALEDLMRRKKSSCAISDFNASRQQPWRELVAQFFDGPDHRPYLSGIDRVTIEYAAEAEDWPENPAQAYLFAGWLASRLGWRILGGGGSQGGDESKLHSLVSPTGQKITLELNARYGVAQKSWLDITATFAKVQLAQAAQAQAHAENAPHMHAPQQEKPTVGPGALMMVGLHATVNGQTGTFTVAREADMVHASTLAQLPQGAPPSQTVHLPTLGEAMLLADQLQQLEHDTLYEDSLTMAAQLINPSLRRAAR